MSRNKHAFYQFFLAVVLALGMTSCASTGPSGTGNPGQIRLEAPQNAPDYVRNLPKSRTGNMPEYTVFGQSYNVLDSAAGFSEQGTASWYGEKFHGRMTSSGEVYDMHSMTAAHKHLPLPTYVRVTNLENNLSVVVKVNDRGPFVGDRIIDLSLAAATQLDMAEQGTANVRIDALSTHIIADSDDASTQDASTQSVVESFEQNAAEKEVVAVQQSVDIIEQFESDIEPYTEGDLAQSAGIVTDINDSNDDFVELAVKPPTALAVAPLVEAPVVEQPTEVQITADDEPLALNGAAAQKADVLAANDFFIQLGAFGKAHNAEALVSDVTEKLGLAAFVEKDNRQDLYRVKVGPFEKGDRLDSTISELASIGIDGYTKPANKR